MSGNKSLVSALSDKATENLIVMGQGPLILASLLVVGGKMPRPPFNLVISNVPGPRRPLYLNGAKLEALYPLSVLLHGQALNITVTSHEDVMDFGILGCRSVMPDIDKLALYLNDSFSELVESVARKKKVVFRMPQKSNAESKMASHADK